MNSYRPLTLFAATSPATQGHSGWNMVALFAAALNSPCSCPFSVSLHPALRALNSEPPYTLAPFGTVKLQGRINSIVGKYTNKRPDCSGRSGLCGYSVLLVFGQQAFSGKVYLAVGLNVYYADEYLVAYAYNILNLLNALVGKLAYVHKALLAGLKLYLSAYGSMFTTLPRNTSPTSISLTILSIIFLAAALAS